MTKQNKPTEISDADLDNAVGGGDVAIQTISLQHEGFEQNSLKPKLTRFSFRALSPLYMAPICGTVTWDSSTINKASSGR